MICPRCGFDNPGGSFCGKCGAQLAVQAAPVYQPPAPKPKSRKMLFIAIIAVVVVVAVVLAAVLVFLPKTDQSTPQSALTNYLDGAKERDANKLLDSTIFHFDSANRSMYIENMTAQWENMSMDDVTVVSMVDISMSNTPADIKLDVTNLTTNLQKKFGITIQESQFVKATIKENNSADPEITYLLLSKVDGKWYFDIFLSYSTEDWAADRSMGDRGEDFSFIEGDDSEIATPMGGFHRMNNSGYQIITITLISSSTVSYEDCEVMLAIGSHISNPIAIPNSMTLTIPISAGTATGYYLTITDSETLGYLSVGDEFTLGPFTGASGLNAVQPTGTQVTLTLVYSPTGGTIAATSFTL